MRITVGLSYSRDGQWRDAPISRTAAVDKWDESHLRDVSFEDMEYRTDGAVYRCVFEKSPAGLSYTLSFAAQYPTQLRLRLEVTGAGECFHIIPCNIYGDNNIASCGPNEAPFLAAPRPGDAMSARRWEFRADRAASPLSAVCFEGGAAGVSVDPYSDGVISGVHWEQAGAVFDRLPVEELIPRLGLSEPTLRETKYIANGVFAQLGGAVGASLGYTNDPVTFTFKRMPNPPTADLAKEARTEGRIYLLSGGRSAVHWMVRAEYYRLRDRHPRAEYAGTLSGAAAALVDAFVNYNFDASAGEYTNMKCLPPEDTVMRPWREVTEIGWTGGSVLAYPLVLARLVGAADEDTFATAMSGERLFDRITGVLDPAMGLFHTSMKPVPGRTDLNSGRWGRDEHDYCSYVFAEAAHYVLRAVDALRASGAAYPQRWLDAAGTVLDTMIRLQRDDGAMGVVYRSDTGAVSDWDGFAGCWFVPAAAYMYHLTGDRKYLDAADRAIRYYRTFVRDLKCFGTPLDTQKAVDEEGNLAFIRGARLLHEYTGESEYLEMLSEGAEYEYLWRYAFNSRPLYPPLNDGWRSKGGSVTSVSHPHIHPMGTIVDCDLRYLYRATGDSYHMERAEDSLSWIMQDLERYPERQGYGRYGVLSERWCPSDGLTIESYSGGEPCSTWNSYNLWAAACALESICEKLLEDRKANG